MADGDFIEGDDGDPFDPDYVARTQLSGEDAANKQREEMLAFARARRNAYKRVFGAANSHDLKIVLDDLRRFCRGDQTAYHDSERIHVLLTGRQEVWLRVFDHLRLDEDAFLEKYNPPQRG